MFTLKKVYGELLEFDATSDLIKNIKLNDKFKVEIQETVDIIKEVSEDTKTKIGQVSKKVLKNFQESTNIEAIVVSIEKKDGNIKSIKLKLVPNRRPNQYPNQKMLKDTLIEGWSLPQQKYELLMSNEKLRNMLKNKELQYIIRRVDSSDNKEKSLDNAMNNENFQKLFYQIMELVHPESAAL